MKIVISSSDAADLVREGEEILRVARGLHEFGNEDPEIVGSIGIGLLCRELGPMTRSTLVAQTIEEARRAEQEDRYASLQEEGIHELDAMRDAVSKAVGIMDEKIEEMDRSSRVGPFRKILGVFQLGQEIAQVVKRIM